MKPNTINSYRLETITRESIFGRMIERKWLREIEIIFTGKEAEYSRYQILCYTLDFQSNVSIQGLDIIQETAYIFDDVRVSLNKEGEIVKVNNRKDIVRRWENRRNKLPALHRGYTVENYCNQVSTLLSNDKEFISFLSEYKMYGLYFNGMVKNNYSTTPNHVRTLTKNELTEDSTITEHWKKAKESTDKKSIFTVTGEIINNSDSKKEDKPEYKGIFLYKKNTLTEGRIDIKNNTKQIQYSLLWIG